MERLVDKAYRRMGAHYLWVPVLGAMPFNLLATLVAATAIVFYFGGSFAEWLRIVAAAAPLSLACILITFLSYRNTLRPVFYWLRHRDDESAAVMAWRTITEHTVAMVRRGVVIFCIPFAFFTFYVISTLDLPLRAFPAILAGVFLVIIWSATMILFWFDWSFAPGLADGGRFLPLDFEPSPPALTARQKLLLASTVFASANILFIGSIPFGIEIDRALGLLLFVVLAVGASLTVARVGNTFLARSVFAQVESLVVAARAVGAGDLSARVTLLSNNEFGHLAASFNRMVRGLAERESLRSALGSYIDPVVGDRLLAEGELLEGEEVDSTILVLDVRGFTTMAETQPARDTVAYLNRVFERVVPLVSNHGGHVNKFMGDGLLAVFGAPERHSDHAARAVEAAREIAGLTERDGEPYRFGIGLNTGDVIAGTVGGGGRLEFAVIGDVVNVAARVEALTRETGDVVLMTKATRDRLADAEGIVSRGRFSVRGRAESIELYALQVAGPAPPASN